MQASHARTEIVYGDISWASTVDGPGTRVVLFLRGCDFNCVWCHSPHLRDRDFSLLFFASRCQLCGACVRACASGVHRIREGRHELDRSRCRRCGRCARVCPVAPPARPLAGALANPVFRVEPEELHRRLRPQLDLLRRLGGGLTVSGGEPLIQYRALRSLLKRCQDDGFRTAVETSGSTSEGAFRALADVVDCWLFGLRPVAEGVGDAEATARFARACSNLKRLRATSGARVIIRMPVVPGVTDALECVAAVAEIMRFQQLEELEILPLNPHASHYYEAMGEPYPAGRIRPPIPERMDSLRQAFVDGGIRARVVR